MLNDNQMVLSDAQAITATANSTNTYDIEEGKTVTTTFTKSPNAIIGNATYFGEDLGLGHGDARHGINGSGSWRSAVSRPTTSLSGGVGSLAEAVESWRACRAAWSPKTSQRKVA